MTPEQQAQIEQAKRYHAQDDNPHSKVHIGNLLALVEGGKAEAQAAPSAWLDKFGEPHRRIEDAKAPEDEAEPTPLYTVPPAQAVSVPADEGLALDLLCLMYDAWENGVGCYEDPEDCSGYVGTAFKLDSGDEEKIIGLLNRRRPQIVASPSLKEAGNQEAP